MSIFSNEPQPETYNTEKNKFSEVDKSPRNVPKFARYSLKCIIRLKIPILRVIEEHRSDWDFRVKFIASGPLWELRATPATRFHSGSIWHFKIVKSSAD
jgi:hypothetical protein